MDLTAALSRDSLAGHHLETLTWLPIPGFPNLEKRASILHIGHILERNTLTPLVDTACSPTVAWRHTTRHSIMTLDIKAQVIDTGRLAMKKAANTCHQRCGLEIAREVVNVSKTGIEVETKTETVPRPRRKLGVVVVIAAVTHLQLGIEPRRVLAHVPQRALVLTPILARARALLPQIVPLLLSAKTTWTI